MLVNNFLCGKYLRLLKFAFLFKFKYILFLYYQGIYACRLNELILQQ